MKIYIYKGGQSLVAKSGVGSAIRHQKNAAEGRSDRDGHLEMAKRMPDVIGTMR